MKHKPDQAFGALFLLSGIRFGANDGARAFGANAGAAGGAGERSEFQLRGHRQQIGKRPPPGRCVPSCWPAPRRASSPDPMLARLAMVGARGRRTPDLLNAILNRHFIEFPQLSQTVKNPFMMGILEYT